jgi:DNA-binding response OmpR family regulator
MQVLVVEDEPKIASILRRGLIEAGYVADVAQDGEEALYKFGIQPYDLIILDLLIPGLSGGGIEVCRQVRNTNSHVPILMLTALDSIKDKIAGLDAGADDYLVKPFNLQELIARIRALLRRGQRVDSVILKFDDLSLSPATKTAERSQREIQLTTKEYALLEYFMSNQNRIINQTELLEHVWDYAYDGLSNVVETYVRYVRKKITVSGESQLIHTVRGSGYIMRLSR